MDTKEILDLYKARWNEINVANNHGNISIQRSHTQLLSVTAQVVELLCERIIELENPTKPVVELTKAARLVADEVDKQLQKQVDKEVAVESTVDKLIRESMSKANG